MSKRTVIKADEELVIKGKLTVEGNVTQIETTQVVNRLESNSLVINSDGENVTAELTLNSDGTLATISFDNADGEFNFNQPINLGSYPITTTGNITGANVIGTYLYGNGSNITGLTTTIVSEGTNLYYTVTRANSAIDARVTTAFVNALAVDYNSLSNTPINVSEFINDAGYLVAANLVSLTANVDSVNGQTGVVTLDTSDIAENGNLYFTNARIDAYLIGDDGIDYANGSISVDSTVVRTSGNQTILGNKTFANTTIFGNTEISAIQIYSDESYYSNIDFTSTANIAPPMRISWNGVTKGLVFENTESPGTTMFIIDDSLASTLINSEMLVINSPTTISQNIVPASANTVNLGSWENHFNYVFANVLHAEYLDLEDANIADIHNSFYVGSASSPSITRSGYGLTFTHNASGAYYEVNAGDGLQISGNNVAVDSTVVRTTGDQTITGNIGINGTLTVAGTINSQNVEDTYVKDTKITLNSNAAVDNTVSIEVNRPVAGANTYIKWDESTDQWKFTNNGSTEFLLPTSTTDLAEGANLYYTSARANTAMDTYLVGGAGLTYSSGTFAVGAGTGITVNADDVQVNAAYVRSLISISDNGGDGSLTYSNSTGIISYAGPSAAELYNHFSAGDGIDITQISAGIIANVSYSPTANVGLVDIAIGYYPPHQPGVDVLVNLDNANYQSSNIRLDSNSIIVPTSSTNRADIRFTAKFKAWISDVNQSTTMTLWSNILVNGNVVRSEYTRNGIAAGNTGSFPSDSIFDVIMPVEAIGLSVNANDIIEFQVSADNTGSSSRAAWLDYTGTSANVVLYNGDIDFSVDSTVIRTTGNQSLANVKTFTGELVIPQNGISPTNNGSIYHDNVDVFAVLNGTAVKLTPQSDVGEIEDVGLTGVDIYAGYRLVAVGNANIKYHGIRSITNGSYIDISEASNVITVAGNATGIRGLISASGNISYNNTTGVISENLTTTDIDEGNNLYFTAARARGNISGSGLITYNSNTGVISTTADNYSNWNVQTDSGVGALYGVTSNSTVIVSGGTGITVTNTGGNITIASTNSADIEAVTAGSGLTGGGTSGAVTLNVGAGDGITVNADNVALSTSGVVAGTYGSASSAPQLIVDSYGRTTSATNVAISISASQVSDFTSASNTAIDARVSGGAGLTYSSGVLAVGAGDGVTVNTDSVELNVAFVRNQFSALSPLSYNAAIGQFSITEIGDISEVVAGDGLTGGGSSGSVTLNIGAGTGITVNADNVALSTSGVTSGTYGSAGSVGQVVIDDYGRVTSATNVAISISASQVSDFTSAANTAIDARIVGGSGLTYSGGTLAVGAGTGISVSADSVSVSGLTISEFANSTIQTSSELFVDSDTVIMTAAAVFDKINAIQAGQGISKITTGDGDAVFDVDLTDITVFTSTNVAGRAVVRDASGNFAANIITATATSARYADLAENYLGDADYLPGTVLVFGGEAEVTACVSYESTRVAGVVTTQPAHVMNSDLTGNHVTCIALRGRVPVKVKGVVRKGDVLVTAGEGHVGYAVASLDPRGVPAAAIVGKAITDKLDAGPGVVEALI